MRLSLFRSKSNTPSGSPASPPKKSNRFTHMLSPTRPRPDDTDPRSSSPLGPAPDSDHPADPLTLPEQTASESQQPRPPLSELAPPSSNAAGSYVGSSSPQKPSSDTAGEQSIMDERAIAQKLMDVESSFLPDPAPSVPNGLKSSRSSSTAIAQRETSKSPNNTNPSDYRSQSYSSDRTHTRPFQSTVIDRHQPLTSASDRLPVQGLQTLGARARSYMRPSNSFRDEDQVSYGESSLTQSPLRYKSSSPSAAAAQRSQLRSSNYLRASARQSSSRSASWSPALDEDEKDEESDAQPTPKQHRDPMPRKYGSLKTHRASKVPASALETSNQPTASAPPVTRPENLRKRQSTQRGSKDSTFSQKSETTIGPGYDGQSADATPGGTNARASRELSRIPSLGSVASSLSGGEVIAPRGRRTVPRRKHVNDKDESGELVTPRANGQAVTAPSNTVLAQQVRDVEVPETLAREYRAAHPTAGSRALNSTPFYADKQSDLPIKAQTSKLDKLTKENFDLKLKIHFLNQRIQERSDENVSDLISHNAQLQADVVNVRRENKELRKRLRNLERLQNGWETNQANMMHSAEGSDEDGSWANKRAQMEDEILYLQGQTKALQADNARLLEGGQPEWTTLDRETTLRKQAEREVRELQQQLQQLRRSNSRGSRLRASSSRPNIGAGESDPSQTDDRDAASLSGVTLVDHLKQENATLRRDLGAQTDMLSSRNRERERLQQEIEDLKLVQRRGDLGGSNVGDSILDRSVSRAQYRSTSRTSDHTRDSQLSDRDRDRLEAVHASLRDDNASLKMRNQGLQRELNSLGESAEHIRELQKEKDDATQALREADGDIDYLYDQMSQLEELVLQKEEDIEALEIELRDRAEESTAFRFELNAINDSFNALADETETNQATIQSLRQDIANANGELEAMESNLRDAAAAKDRLEVQQESAEGEIAFLREEQEADKLRIGDLQSELASARAGLNSEGSRSTELEKLQAEARNARNEARMLRNSLSTKETENTTLRDKFTGLQRTFDLAEQEFEHIKTGLMREINTLKTDSDKRLQELDQANLDYDEQSQVLQDREGLLELSGHETRRLTELLEKERQGRKHDRNEYERTLRNAKGTPAVRVIELEASNNQEKAKTADLEQKLQEQAEREQQLNSDRAEMERKLTSDRAEMEQKHSDQLHSRDTLFLSLWTRLSGLCTSEKLMEPEQASQTPESIASDLETFDQHISTVIDAIESHVGDFRQHLVDTEKGLWNGFRRLEHGLEERQTRIEELQHSMQQVMDARSDQPIDHTVTVEYVNRLRNENKAIKRELRYLKQSAFALPGLAPSHTEDRARGDLQDFDYPDSASLHSNSSNEKNPQPMAHTGLLRTYSAGAADHPLLAAQEQLPDPQLPKRSLSSLTTVQDLGPTSRISIQPGKPSRGISPSTQTSSSDQRWVLKLEALKRTLHAEREGRLLDRDGARKRLEEGKRQSGALKEELKRERLKREAAAAAAAADKAGSASDGKRG